MARTTMHLTPAGPFGRPTHPVTGWLLAVSAVLLSWAARLEQQARRARERVPRREFELREVGGEAVGAVFEDGKLVGVLPGVTRL
ncbi:MAG: hypothetical protein ING52_07880 [Burkholderiales bacterium]|jgi:hypothetical protein|nr:hypothetical protein [Burkholderiales bacterium]MCE2645566.1 hypothetical protein [Burkholderiaceae bacterium]MCA3213834.1 hypothetical protein [Burkholderiales bacterium]MCA3223825.1 hypothetical protein [Burkholderiales bacterium]MCA3225412.1 hypothetical protein [Burkholderiales bacterium]